VTLRDGAIVALGNELVRLRKASESMRAQLASGLDLEAAAMSVLFTAVHGGPQRGTDLARSLGLDPSTMSRHVSTLVRRELVHRVPDPADGRAQLVEATEAGRLLHRRLLAQRTTEMHRMLADWPDADLESLAALLNRFNDTFDTTRIHEGAR